MIRALILPALRQNGTSSLSSHRYLQLQRPLLRCLSTTSNSAVGTAVKAEEDFFEKNKRLKRPMSPHLTIYQPQITSVLSLTHRATGIALTGMTSLVALGAVMSSTPFPTFLAAVEAAQYGSAAIFAAKYIVAFPLVYHMLNGIRHLAWDLGKGFELKQLYASGYTVLAASILLSIVAASM